MNPICYQMRIVVASVFVTLLYAASVQAGPVIDFEDIERGGVGTSLVSSGYRFVVEPDGLLIIDGPLGPSRNGTQTLFVFQDGPLTMTEINGDSFDLFSFDVAEGNPELPASQLFVNVSFADGAESDFVIDLDHVLVDFETVAFEDLTDIVSVTFMADGGSGGLSLDNIVVPEPGTILLLLVGSGFVLLRWRTRRGVSLLVVSLVAMLAAGLPAARAQWTRGPIMIGGDDTNDTSVHLFDQG